MSKIRTQLSRAVDCIYKISPLVPLWLQKTLYCSLFSSKLSYKILVLVYRWVYKTNGNCSNSATFGTAAGFLVICLFRTLLTSGARSHHGLVPPPPLPREKKKEAMKCKNVFLLGLLLFSFFYETRTIRLELGADIFNRLSRTYHCMSDSQMAFPVVNSVRRIGFFVRIGYGTK